MTKWVTFLLLVLAILSYGLSQMRPATVDSEQTASSQQTPTATVESPNPEETEAPPLGQEGTVTAPKFGPPPGAKSTPKVVAGGSSKSDPFSKTKKKLPEMVPGTIKATIFSTQPNGSARTKFSPSTKEIYLTVTPEGLDGKVDVVARYRSVLEEGAEFSQPVESSGPPRRRVFRFTAPESGWESGPYQVVYKVKGTDQVLGLERFEILDPEEELPKNYPDPEYLDLVPDLEAQEARSTFSSDQGKILLRVSAQQLAPGTNIRTVWSAVEVDRLTSGELIAVHSQPAPGEGRDAVFTFEAPPGGFLTGSYNVDVYFGEKQAGAQAFFVKPPETPESTETPESSE